jgi:prepilin-type N-terminal cleavage/methylation domain-containing protein
VAGLRQIYPRLRQRIGFSLIELLIVMTIVGLLLGIAVPRIGTQVNSDRANRSASAIMGMLDEASQLAARRRAPVTVKYVSGTLTVADRATGTAIRSRSFGPTSDLRGTVTFSPSAGIEIFPNGRANAALTVTVTGGSASASVTRSATGILRRN